ncbi:glycosyltransferase family 2 protein [Flavobacterium sp.]|uniref:glycosyltransferase family 2 protein n=1 Tax=Flavobacterium sp. TaxID=239 RepID=UPI002C803461|nr:glycosyltransferase family 2 protein [Flavobacterium sp.]HSD07368.1 glycosyltransferase family 2 protein [Flavobacterium sp.]
MNPLISIIIPTYNRAHLIGKTLDSIIAQTYTNWECIIVDDGSTDDTAEVLGGYITKDRRFQYHLRPETHKPGGNGARNYGYSLCKGQYIKWFDSDDVMLLDCLEKQIGDTPFYDVSVCRVIKYDFQNHKALGITQIFSEQVIRDYLLGRVIFYICGPIWNREFIQKQSILFDESISNLDDWDFNLRMLYQEPSIVYIDEPLIQYRIHGNSLSHEINKLNFEEIKSEFKARNKHLKLLKSNKLVDSRILQNYIVDRYKFIFREALLINDHKKKYYLRMLLVSQLKILDSKGFIKTIFGFVIFSVFGKGYKLLKQ